MTKTYSLTLAFAASAIAATSCAGCGNKQDLTKAQTAFRRWDQNWKEARPCLVGTSERSPDLALQIDLHQLLDDRVDCSDWVLTATPFPSEQGLNRMSDKDAQDWLRKYENIDNTWTELTSADLTDESAAGALDLQTATRALQHCGLAHCRDLAGKITAIENERAALGAALGVPVDVRPPIAQATQVVDAAPRPRTRPANELFAETAYGTAPVNATWSLVKERAGDRATYTMTAGATTQVLDLHGQVVAIGVIRDDADPIVWATGLGLGGPGVDYARVFQLGAGGKWTSTDVGPVRYVGAAGHRLDLLFANDDDGKQKMMPPIPSLNVNWGMFAPGLHDHHWLEVPVSLEHHAWACSAPSGLWQGISFDDGKGNLGEIDYWAPRTTLPDAIKLELAPAVPLGCDDTAVLVEQLGMCTRATKACAEAAGSQLFRGEPLHVGALALTDDDPRRQLVLVRTPKHDRIVRLPPKVRVIGFQPQIEVRDGKVIAAVSGHDDQEIELE